MVLSMLVGLQCSQMSSPPGKGRKSVAMSLHLSASPCPCGAECIFALGHRWPGNPACTEKWPAAAKAGSIILCEERLALLFIIVTNSTCWVREKLCPFRKLGAQSVLHSPIKMEPPMPLPKNQETNQHSIPFLRIFLYAYRHSSLYVILLLFVTAKLMSYCWSCDRKTKSVIAQDSPWRPWKHFICVCVCMY